MGNTIQVLESAGIRPTSSRILIYKGISTFEDTFSLSDVEMLMPTVDKSTIFRALTLFLSHHLIHSMEDGSGQVKYCLCTHPDDCEQEEEHVHFYCKVCRKSYCLHDTHVGSIPLPEGFVATGVNYIVKGICADCRTKGHSISDYHTH